MIKEIIMETVSMLSIIGMAFSFIISVGLPFVLLVFALKKLKANPLSFLIGAITFIVSALLLEQIFHTVMFRVFGSTLQENLILYAIYVGLSAGIFEETGRLFSMKVFMKKTLSKENALMYGIGHGGCEAIMIVGLTSISNIVTSVMINTGSIGGLLDKLDPAVKETTLQKLSLLWLTPSYQFYMAGAERISAILLHICLSYLVYKAVKNNKLRIYVLAILIHAAIDAATVLLAQNVPVYVFEMIVFAVVLLLSFAIHRKYEGNQIQAV